MNQRTRTAVESHGVRTIEAELLLQELRSHRPVLVLDVRRADEFQGPRGRLPGSRSIPLAHLYGRWPEIGVDRSRLVVTVSNREDASQLAGLELELAGFTEVRALRGGLQRWIELGFPIEHAASGVGT